MTDQVQAARHLGHPFGVNADVMNVALRNAGILEGEPGNWRPTAAAADWVKERELTNGRHPDPRQNPYFTQRKKTSPWLSSRSPRSAQPKPPSSKPTGHRLTRSTSHH